MSKEERIRHVSEPLTCLESFKRMGTRFCNFFRSPENRTPIGIMPIKGNRGWRVDTDTIVDMSDRRPLLDQDANAPSNQGGPRM